MQGLASLIGNISVDLFGIAVFFAAIFLYGIYRGKDKLVAMLLSWYGATALYFIFPYDAALKSLGTTPVAHFASRIFLFAVFFTLFYVTLKKNLVGDFSYERMRRYLEAGLLSGFFVALICILLYHIIPIKGIYSFSPLITALFAPQVYYFWWLVLPISWLFLSSRR